MYIITCLSYNELTILPCDISHCYIDICLSTCMRVYMYMFTFVCFNGLLICMYVYICKHIYDIYCVCNSLYDLSSIAERLHGTGLTLLAHCTKGRNSIRLRAKRAESLAGNGQF